METVEVMHERKDESDEDDREDLDFNPFLQHSTSPEASSGLSSEGEDVDEETARQNCDVSGVQDGKRGCSVVLYGESNFDNASNDEQEEDDEFDIYDITSVEISAQPCGLQDEEAERCCKGLAQMTTNSALSDKDYATVGKQSDEEDEEAFDAICKRTRAHYSLADMSLDELETFLQESDEEDYFQNIDDEEEYRKFVAAVQGKIQDDLGTMNENFEKGEDEDEEDDFDFELEIEEAIESDYEEKTKIEACKRRKPRTKSDSRQKRRREAKAKKERLLGSARTLIRPILPVGMCANEPKKKNTDESYGKPSLSAFTTSQIGQLYCLMYEHVQLLTQVFALSILDPCQQHTSDSICRLLQQLVDTRDQVLRWRRVPFPDICFLQSSIKSSTSHTKVSERLQHLCSMGHKKVIDPELFKSSNASNAHSVQHQPNDVCDEGGAAKYFQSSCSSDQHLLANGVPFVNDQGVIMYNFLGDAADNMCEWTPAINRPVFSLLDVPPLVLVKEFLADVSNVVEKSKQQQLQNGFSHATREHVPMFSPARVPPVHGDSQAISQDSSQLKKTMATVIVENTKRESIALVPKEISALTSRFANLFNPLLLPRKPPPASLVRRILFTDAEDELLAIGLMTYNNNWEAIQNHYLPSKTAHQIFIRQKNRSASRAPENSIKAVRKLKTSPLTNEELSRIEEALKMYKHDWVKDWKECVPYRDPATLSRLWRVAIHSHKSSKLHNVEAKHNLIATAEGPRKQYKDLARTQIPDGVGDECEISEGEVANSAYLHEAFLRKSPSHTPTSSVPASRCTNLSSFSGIKCLQGLSEEKCFSDSNGGNLAKTEMAFRQLCASSIQPPESSTMRKVSSNFTYSISKRRHKSRLFVRGTHTIKLAPGLPLLNLPPSVRVIPQSKLGSDHPLNLSSSVHVISHSKSSEPPHSATSLLHSCSSVKEKGVASLEHSVCQNKLASPSQPRSSSQKQTEASVEAAYTSKLHPLLIQGTFEPSAPSCLELSKGDHSHLTFCRSSPQEIGHCTDSSLWIVPTPNAQHTRHHSHMSASPLLHPFLREQEQDGCKKKVSHFTREDSEEREGKVQWPSVLFGPLVQSVQKQQKQGRLSKVAHDCSSMPSTICVKSSKGSRRKKSCDAHAKRREKEKENELNLNLYMNLVMEQEELSDSETEGIQFEHEEMDDSDREEYDNGIVASDPEKVDENIHFEKEEIGSDDSSEVPRP